MKRLLLVFIILACGCCTVGPSKSAPKSGFALISIKFMGAFPQKQGSGVVIGQYAEGAYVLTAAHVCEKNPLDSIHVKVMNKEEVTARVVRFDPDTDMCVLAAMGVENAHVVRVARNGPKAGDEVYSISAPFGITEGETVPIIRGIYAGPYKRWDMYNLRIAPGSSGGMIINKRNELVGMTSAFLLNDFSFYDMSLGPKFDELKEFLNGY